MTDTELGEVVESIGRTFAEADATFAEEDELIVEAGRRLAARAAGAAA